MIDETALLLARRIAGDAEWSRDECSWSIVKSHVGKDWAVTARHEVAGGSLYQGTSGIGLMLGWAAVRFGGDPELRRAAVGAMTHAVRRGMELPSTSAGLYGGRLGIAWAAGRLGTMLSCDSLVHSAAELANTTDANGEAIGFDFLTGAAGAAMAYIKLIDLLGDNSDWASAAMTLGDYLVAAANKHSIGWSWPADQSGYARRGLLGLAHGASGAAHALRELFLFSNDGRYLYGMDQAFAYERQFLGGEMPNWPDFRNGSFGQAYQQEGKEGIKAILQSEGNIWTEDSPPMLAWCHGAPGITLARLAAFRSLGCELARADAQVGATTTALTLGDVSNFSLCHGRGGNLETLLFASEVEDAPDYRRTALEEVAGACEQYGGGSQPWPCGTIYGIPDPSLLVGEAGVLYTLLRCTSGCQLSVLIPTSERRANSLQTTPEYRMQQRLHMEEVLPESLRVLDKIRASPVFFGRVERPICELYHRIHSLIIDQDDPVAAGLLSELTRIERVRFKLSFRHRYDAVQDYIHLLEGELMEEGGLEGRKVRLVSGTTVIQCRPDTDALRKLWASNQATSVITGALNRQKVQHVMFYPWMGQVVFRPISSLAAQLFRALQAGRSSEEVEEDLRLSSNVDYTGDLSAWIDSQFRELARSGLLEPHRGVSRVSSTDGGS